MEAVSCPICSVSLKLLSEREREEHCDICLDSCSFLETNQNRKRAFSELEEITITPTSTNENHSPSSNGLIKQPRTAVNNSKWASILKGKEASVDSPVKTGNNFISKQRQMPFYKVLRFGEQKIAVDAFNYNKIPNVTAYFLTHFHSDHYGGLGKTWSHGPIYCSPETARLVILQLKVDPQYIHPVEFNKEVEINNIKVLFLDANHCPGAAIILFNRDVLHTGDFRASEDLIIELKKHHVQLKTLYLDTTYLDPSRKFPPQQTVIDTCAQLCSYLQSRPARYDFFFQRNLKQKILVLVGTYTIGKERIAVGIAKALNTKIWATPSKRKILEAIGDNQITDILGETENECQVYLTYMNEVNLAKMKPRWNKWRNSYSQVIGIVPTGWTWKSSAQKFDLETLKNKNAYTSADQGSIRVYKVPYSEHSSYAELENFCHEIPCRNIISTVTSKNQNILQQWQKQGKAKSDTKSSQY